LDTVSTVLTSANNDFDLRPKAGYTHLT